MIILGIFCFVLSGEIFISDVNRNSLTKSDSQNLKIVSAAQFRQDDKKRRAEKLFAEAEELFNKNTPEARAEAVPKYLETLKLWREIGDERQQIEPLNKLVDIHTFSGDYAKALEFSEQLLPIARKLGEKNLEGGVLFNIGRYYDALGETRKGLQYVEQSAQMLNQIGERQREGIALNSVGVMNYKLGEIQKAFDIYNRVLVLRRELGDRRGEAYTLINLGYSYSDGGDKRKAVEFYEQARQIAVEIKDSRAESLVINNLASVLHDMGEYQKAFDLYQKSLSLYRTGGDKYGEAVQLNNLASLYRDLGDFENALKFIGEASAIYQAGGFRREEARALSSTGAIYSANGDKAKALELFQKALEIHRSLENKEGRAGVLRNVGKIYLEAGELQKASENLQTALKLAEEVQDAAAIADILTLLAQTFEKLNDAAKAEASFIRAQSIQTGFRSETAESLYQYARFEERSGRRTSALEKMREVLKIVEDLRNSVAAPDFRSGFLAQQQKYFDFYIGLLVAQHRAEPKKGFDALALQVSENARARSLLESLGESQTDIRARAAPELLTRERILRQSVNAKESQRQEAVRQKNAARAAEYEKEISEMIRQYRETQAEIRRQSPQFAVLIQPEALSLTEIQTNVLDDDTVLLEYFLGEDKSYLFFATRRSLEVFDLPAKSEIEPTARSFVENLRARASENLRESPAERQKRIQTADRNWQKDAQKLSEILLAPVAGKIQNKRLLIVSSGVLQYVPFAALQVQSPKSKVQSSKTKNLKPETKNFFLIETNEIINLPSVSVLSVLRNARKNRVNAPKNLAAVLADPVFAADDARVKSPAKKPANEAVITQARLSSPKLRSDFARLRFSRAEAEAISAFLPNDKKLVAFDFSANLKTVHSEEFAKSRIIHFATHGVVNSEFPELSGIVLSLIDENGKAQDGFLRLHDIYNLRLEADLVVLSACETALGKDIQGEGIIGLTRGFMYAGNADVMASLWQVDDRATAELMKRFYQNLLKENQHPAAALRNAQISMLKETATQNPFYWAGFVLQGDFMHHQNAER
jgi:CHAT domain-containing protein/tetratricopeptide (TPR) repeat protein